MYLYSLLVLHVVSTEGYLLHLQKLITIELQFSYYFLQSVTRKFNLRCFTSFIIKYIKCAF